MRQRLSQFYVLSGHQSAGQAALRTLRPSINGSLLDYLFFHLHCHAVYTFHPLFPFPFAYLLPISSLLLPKTWTISNSRDVT